MIILNDKLKLIWQINQKYFGFYCLCHLHNERGNSIPDVSILKSLSNILNVSGTELINGERINNEKEK